MKLNWVELGYRLRILKIASSLKIRNSIAEILIFTSQAGENTIISYSNLKNIELCKIDYLNLILTRLLLRMHYFKASRRKCHEKIKKGIDKHGQGCI